MTTDLVADYRKYIIEFPSKTNNLVSYKTITELIEIFRVSRTDDFNEYETSDVEGQVEDLKRVYAMLRDAENRKSTDFIEEIIAMTKPEDSSEN